MFVTATNAGLSVKAYRGDAKTLLAFDLPQGQADQLAGFTIGFTAARKLAYVRNSLQFATPSDHAQDPRYSAYDTINAPLHRFWWVHVPGADALDGTPTYGPYEYTVTPRYFQAGKLQPLDPTLGVTLKIKVAPFSAGAVTTAFTRGFTQSQAFVRRFGAQATFRPNNDDLLFDTSQVSGTAPDNTTYTYAEQYGWLGFTARRATLDLLADVQADPSLSLEVFAYDLDEPDICAALLALAKAGRVRMILDDSPLHHGTKKKGAPPEDRFETEFTKVAAAPAAIERGNYARYAHDKVIVVSKTDAAGNSTPTKVLTGSTNFSVTGLYVNSNHVLIFDDRAVAAQYARVFEESWAGEVQAGAFRATADASTAATFATSRVPKTIITFSPHSQAYAQQILDDLTGRITAESTQAGGSVFFAVMDIDSGGGPVFAALKELHKVPTVFSYGISDSTDGIYLYSPSNANGVLVTGKPGRSRLPKPFDQVPVPRGHQVHHKFVVCGFNGPQPVVYCGSSNLALGGEQANGDNLIAIYDADVATVFAIEALALVDHFDFLDHSPAGTASARNATAASTEGWVLSTTSRWATKFYARTDQHFATRTALA